MPPARSEVDLAKVAECFAGLVNSPARTIATDERSRNPSHLPPRAMPAKRARPSEPAESPIKRLRSQEVPMADSSLAKGVARAAPVSRGMLPPGKLGRVPKIKKPIKEGVKRKSIGGAATFDIEESSVKKRGRPPVRSKPWSEEQNPVEDEQESTPKRSRGRPKGKSSANEDVPAIRGPPVPAIRGTPEEVHTMTPRSSDKEIPETESTSDQFNNVEVSIAPTAEKGQQHNSELERRPEPDDMFIFRDYVESEGSEDDPQSELFGEWPVWKKIIRAAREIDLRIDDTDDEHRRKVKTKTFQKFLKAVNLTAKYYHDIRENFRGSESYDLQSAVHSLASTVAAMPKTANGTSAKNLVYDIYGYGIPSILFLVDCALKAHSNLYSDTEDIEILQEVVTLQDTAIVLCEKAKVWSREPKNELSDEESTKGAVRHRTSEADLRDAKSKIRAILPRLKHVRGTFHDELRARLARCKYERQKEQLAESYQLRDEQYRRQEEQTREKIAIRRREMARGARGSAVKPRAPAYQPPDRWSDEMDLQLLEFLEGYSHQPIKERYLSCLTASLLQNKLPEHIRTRALELQPAMVATYQNNELEVPDWVTSLE